MLKGIKWYWWVLLGLAILMTIYVVIVSKRTNPKKVEKKIMQSDPEKLLTSESDSYTQIARTAEVAIKTGDLSANPKVIKGKPVVLDTNIVQMRPAYEYVAGSGTRAPGYNVACSGEFVTQTEVDNNWGGSIQNYIDEKCYGKKYIATSK